MKKKKKSHNFYYTSLPAVKYSLKMFSSKTVSVHYKIKKEMGERGLFLSLDRTPPKRHKYSVFSGGDPSVDRKDRREVWRWTKCLKLSYWPRKRKKERYYFNRERICFHMIVTLSWPFSGHGKSTLISKFVSQGCHALANLYICSELCTVQNNELALLLALRVA